MGDPFFCGGWIPLEAQQLGLCAHGSDLNPVAVLITKALVETPPRFTGRSPTNSEARAEFAAGAAGMARVRQAWPRTCAIADAGCVARQRSGSAISARRV